MMQLVRLSDGAVIASFQKSRWASFHSSIKTKNPPNKSKLFIGTLQWHGSNFSDAIKATTNQIGSRTQQILSKVDDFISGDIDTKKKDEATLNADGAHAGNLLEDAITLSCWIVVEAEHRLRYKVFDLLEEIGEQAEGG
jgi:hypothetical protein